MTTSQQIAEFTAFAKTVAEQEGEHVSLDDIYQRWWDEQHSSEDLAAIQEAHQQYESGERGEDARAVLASIRQQRVQGGSP